jgi:predicted O-linked N-acetylglucosamine transferase (SPINDLY family)
VNPVIQRARYALQTGRPDDAVALLENWLTRTPGDVAALAELGRIAMLFGDPVRAESLLARALALTPGDPELLAYAAVACELAGKGDAALAFGRQALDIDPGQTIAAALITRLLTDRCLPTEAIAIAQRALTKQSDNGQIRRALASAQLFRGQATEAIASAQAALRQLSNDPATIGTALSASLYDETIDDGERTALHRRIAANIRPAVSHVPLQPLRGRRLRVGFCSADFRQHPVGQLVLPILEQLDRERFEPFCYAHLENPDGLTRIFRTQPLAWRDVTRLDDDTLLATMRADQLDVLVDLAGHTHGGRPRVIRGRAARVQLSWLGYLNTSGLPEMDGLIGDDIVLPTGCEPLFNERLWRLPLGFFCLQASSPLPPVAALPMLSRGYPTLGSFNHLAKLSDATVALWSRLLQARANARLMLCAVPLLEPATRDFTLARFVAHGIDPARIELRPPQPPGEQFLKQYDDIDLALDPLPFSGGATTLDALRQGVPVVTRPSSSMHTRTSANLLHRLGLNEFVAADEDAYLDIATRWLADADALAKLRASLRTRLTVSPANDSDRYTRDFEQLLLDAATN